MKLKRLALLLLALALLSGLAACGDKEPAPAPTAEPTAEPTPSPTPEPWEPVLDAFATLPRLDTEQARDMSSWMNSRCCLIEDGMFYGKFFVKGDNSAKTVAFEVVNDGSSVQAGAWRVLDDDYWPLFITKRGDVLYYIFTEAGSGDKLGVARVNTDGSDRQVLYQGKCNNLSVTEDALYFTNEDYRLMRADLDGGNVRTVIDKEVFYACLLNAEWVIYQDDADKESLHLFYIPEEIDIKLNDEPSYYPLLTGSLLFYKTKSVENPDARHLTRIDLSQWEEVFDEALGCHVPVFTAEKTDRLSGSEFFIDGDQLWPSNNFNGTSLAAWKNLEDDAYKGYTRVTRFASEDYQVTETMNNQSTKDITIHDRHTNYGYSIPWLR